jgi:hypothetical protein
MNVDEEKINDYQRQSMIIKDNQMIIKDYQ